MTILAFDEPWTGGFAPWPPFRLNQNSPLANGLVEQWTLVDSVGLNHALTARHPLAFSANALDQNIVSNTLVTRTLRWDGTSHFAEVVNGPNFPNLISNFTVAAWLTNENPDGVRRFFCSGGVGSGATGYSIGKSSTGNSVRFTKNGVADLDINIGAWPAGIFFLVFRVNSNASIDVFVNGQLAGSSANTSAITSRTHHFTRLAANSNVAGGVIEPWTGQIPALGVWSRALGNAEILNLYSPNTRWDLYAPRRTFVTVAAVTGPLITSIDTDDIVFAGQQAVIVAGSGFGATQ